MKNPTRRDIFRYVAASTVVSAASRSIEAQHGADMAPLRNVPWPQEPNLENTAFDRVTLEMSLKPFRQTDQAYIEAVCQDLFHQWLPLIRRVESVAVLLWSADGSEILDYRGRSTDEFEWAKWIGIGNRPEAAPGDDPDRKGLHSIPHLYIDNPPVMTYGVLGRIVATLKRIGTAVTGKPVTVGATFDPGPEFAKSSFKYKRHPEIANDNTMGHSTFVTCVTHLHADNVAYAAFPNGITEGMSLGTFLGGQAQHFLSDLGFDCLWLSNGFGFSVSPWAVKGPLFDGTKFDVHAAPSLRDAILGFWKDFRKQCPKFPLETRGTNLLLGSDLATNACPLQQIYEGGFNMIAPPNSPWAAIDGDFGLELVGYLSRIAELPPDGRFPFRFYVHDPWWLNSPWFDRYGREPHDIYLPLAVARINGNAGITRPAFFEMLTVDNSYGRMPEQAANEVTPHVLGAVDDFSDAPGLLTWICPFREYHDMVFGKSPNPQLPFFADWYLRGAVNTGLPLNSVVSTTNFLSTLRQNPTFFDETVLLTLVPTAGSPLEEVLLDRVRRGLPVLFYGPVTDASKMMLEYLGLTLSDGIDGELTLQSNLHLDDVQHGVQVMRFQHRSLTNAGNINTVAQPGTKVLATVNANGKERAYAVQHDNSAWIRGTFCSRIPENVSARIPIPDDPATSFPAEALARAALAQLGVSIVVNKTSPETRLPVIFGARCRNGYFFSGYAPSTTSSVRFRLSIGAPLFVGREAWLEDGHAVYTLPRAWHHEARVFVQTQQIGEVSCVEYYAGMTGFRRRTLIKGLKDATVTFLPEDKERVIFQVNDMRLHVEQNSIPVTRSENGRRLTVHGITGSLFISW
ncbi:hypothetical protein [Terriglobus sp. ADX1]|uniref:hypothetical protein n=1 Tax=Terriglobus sp. ADX1 TaxID=2794063 RepID=UPI002FE56749